MRVYVCVREAVKGRSCYSTSSLKELHPVVLIKLHLFNLRSYGNDEKYTLCNSMGSFSLLRDFRPTFIITSEVGDQTRRILLHISIQAKILTPHVAVADSSAHKFSRSKPFQTFCFHGFPLFFAK